MYDEKQVAQEIAELFYKDVCHFGFEKPVVCETSKWTTDIYFLHEKHAIGIEIDWFEREVFVSLVRLINRELPGNDVRYRYADGSTCRTSFFTIYRVMPKRHKGNKDGGEGDIQHLKAQTAMYLNLIINNPEKLLNYMKNI